jgi:hypothetical protein
MDQHAIGAVGNLPDIFVHSPIEERQRYHRERRQKKGNGNVKYSPQSREGLGVFGKPGNNRKD